MKIKLQTITNVLFYISFCLITLFSYMGNVTLIGNYLNVFSKISLVLLLLVFILKINSFSRREVFISFCLLMLSLLNLLLTNDYSLLKMMIIILCIRNVDIRKFIKFDFIIRILIIFIMLLFIKIGFANDIFFYNNGMIKHSLGFLNPNRLGLLSLIIFLEYIYLNWNDSFIKYLILFIPICYLNYYIGCKSSLYMIFFSLMLKILYNLKKNIFEISVIKHLIVNSYCYLMVISFIFFILYRMNSSLGIILNRIMTDRLFNMSIYFNEYNIVIFGKFLNINLTLDTFYYYIIYGYGLAYSILIILAFRLLFKELYKNKYYGLILAFIVFAFYGISERLWFNIDYNVFICFFSLIVYKKSEHIVQSQKSLIGEAK